MVRDRCCHQNGWIYRKVPNSLWPPPPHFHVANLFLQLHAKKLFKGPKSANLLLLWNQEQAAEEGLEQTIKRNSKSHFFWDTPYVRDVGTGLELRILALYIAFSCNGETHKKMLLSRNANWMILTVSSFVFVRAKQHGRNCFKEMAQQ